MGSPAARLGDMHICPMYSGDTPHVGGPVGPIGSPNVNFGGLPATRMGDMAACSGPPDLIVGGSTTVFINGLPAARMGDGTAHGGAIVQGLPTVNIG